MSASACSQTSVRIFQRLSSWETSLGTRAGRGEKKEEKGKRGYRLRPCDQSTRRCSFHEALHAPRGLVVTGPGEIKNARSALICLFFFFLHFLSFIIERKKNTVLTIFRLHKTTHIFTIEFHLFLYSAILISRYMITTLRYTFHLFETTITLHIRFFLITFPQDPFDCTEWKMFVCTFSS